MPIQFEFFGVNDPGNKETERWVSERIPNAQRGFRNFVSLSVTNGRRIGGVLYHDWNPEAGTIQMSAAGGNGWLTRPVLYAMHYYPFCIGCQMIVLQTAEDNAVMRRIAKAYGYAEIIVPRLMGRDRNAALLTLTHEDWQKSPFHERLPNEQTRRASAA